MDQEITSLEWKQKKATGRVSAVALRVSPHGRSARSAHRQARGPTFRSRCRQHFFITWSKTSHIVPNGVRNGTKTLRRAYNSRNDGQNIRTRGDFTVPIIYHHSQQFSSFLSQQNLARGHGPIGPGVHSWQSSKC